MTDEDIYAAMTDDELRQWLEMGDVEAGLELEARQADYTVSRPGDPLWIDGIALDEPTLKRAFPHPDDEATREAKFWDDLTDEAHP